MSATPVGQLYTSPARTSAMEGAGQAIQGLAGDVGHIFQAEQQRRAADYTTKTSAEIQEFVIREMDNSQKQALAAGNVDGYTENFLKSYDETVAKALESAPNDLGREALSERMMQARNSLLAQSMKFESSARIKIYESNLDKAADNYAKAAATDPSQIPQLMKQLEGDMAAATETLGLTDARDRMDFYKNQILSTTASQMMQSNPSAALGLVEQYKDSLSAKNYASLSKSAQYQQKVLEAQAQKALEEKQENDAVWAAVNGGVALNPESVKSQKIVDKAYIEAKQEDPTVDFTQVVERTKILPKTMADDITAQLATGSPSQQVEAARQLKRLHQTVPNLVNKMSATNKARAMMIAEAVEGGVKPETAVQWADKQTNIADARVMKERESSFKKEKLNFDSIQSEFTSFFGPGSDAIPDQMQVEGKMLLQGYYVNSGLTAEQAKSAALNDLKGNWHYSKSTGRGRYMKHAPETVYGNEHGSDWIKEELFGEISKHAMFDEKPEATLKRTVIEANPYLDNEGQIVYNVYMFDKQTGGLEPFYDANGVPVKFKPSWEESGLYESLMEKYQGQTTEERYQAYLNDVAEKRAKHELYGQVPVWDWTSAGLEGGF
jgi:hypothetical protein